MSYQICNGYNAYSIMPEGKVWDYDAVNDQWNVLHHSSLSLAVRMFFKYINDKQHFIPFIFPLQRRLDGINYHCFSLISGCKI